MFVNTHLLLLDQIQQQIQRPLISRDMILYGVAISLPSLPRYFLISDSPRLRRARDVGTMPCCPVLRAHLPLCHRFRRFARPPFIKTCERPRLLFSVLLLSVTCECGSPQSSPHRRSPSINDPPFFAVHGHASNLRRPGNLPPPISAFSRSREAVIWPSHYDRTTQFRISKPPVTEYADLALATRFVASID